MTHSTTTNGKTLSLFHHPPPPEGLDASKGLQASPEALQASKAPFEAFKKTKARGSQAESSHDSIRHEVTSLAL